MAWIALKMLIGDRAKFYGIVLGLTFSALWKRRHPADEVRLFEQNAADATWGFGVVFSDQALEFLREDDPGTVEAVAPHMQTWRESQALSSLQRAPSLLAFAQKPPTAAVGGPSVCSPTQICAAPSSVHGAMPVPVVGAN